MKKPNKKISDGRETASGYAEPTRRALELTDFCDRSTDPMGSYTGCPLDPYETPVQDADDL